MSQPQTVSDALKSFAAARLVRYSQLRPCTSAFIDTRTPGSKEKENFTIIGPGVAENPDQHVHIEIPHGFNIGGARQPPGCVNSQHSHETAEVFVVHSGRWAFDLGPNREDGRAVLETGDVISIPTQVFRGFENVGEETGFLFAVLGGDDPGHVTWAPYVFDQAKDHGLVLLEDGSLVDTVAGERIPDGKRPMPPTTEEDVARLRRLSGEELERCIVRHETLVADIERSPSPNIHELPVIGGASPDERIDAGQLDWSHGFNLRYLCFSPKSATDRHIRHEEEVLFVQSGHLTVGLEDGDLQIGPGDTLTMPIGMPRVYRNDGSVPAQLYVVRGGDQPRRSQRAAA